MKIRWQCLFCCCVVFLGCRYERQHKLLWPADLPNQFSSQGQVPVEGRWWLSFGDPVLNSLIEQGVEQNFSIRAAWERFTQAEQLAVKTGASVFPTANYQTEWSGQRKEVLDKSIYTRQYNVGVAAAYELDLWGRIDSLRSAAQMDAAAAQEQVQAAAISLSASIARMWFELVEARLQEQLLARQVKTNQDVLEIITLQFRQGLIGASNVFRQKQLVEATQGQLISAKERTVLLGHQLAILLGKTPAIWQPPSSEQLPEIGPLPSTGVPAEVLLRRPDIASVAKQIAAADLRTYAALTELFPQFTLTAGAQTGAARPTDLFQDWLASLSAGLAGPLFDAGARQAEMRRQRAVRDERLSQFAQSILVAVGEVEDALAGEQFGYQRLENIRQQLESAKMVYQRTKDSYLKGQLDYLRVLDALISQQSLERSELTARRELLESRIALCRALAGPIPLERPPLSQFQDGK